MWDPPFSLPPRGGGAVGALERPEIHIGGESRGGSGEKNRKPAAAYDPYFSGGNLAL